MQNIKQLESEIQCEVDPMQNLDINLKAKYTYQVKVGNKYGVKNSPEQIKKNGKRYQLQDNPFHFFKEAEAYDAARILGGRVVKSQ